MSNNVKKPIYVLQHISILAAVTNCKATLPAVFFVPGEGDMPPELPSSQEQLLAFWNR
jgi:hypothetical protein